MDTFLARTLGVAALLAGAGVFYHYVVHLPGVEREKKAAEEAAAAQLLQDQQQRAVQYQICMSTARRLYDQNWAEACKNVASTKTRELNNCLETPSIVSNPYMGRQWCEKQYGDIDPSADCTLPGPRADGVNQYYTESKQQCETDAKMAGT